MEATYSYEKKKRLAERISKVKRKEDMVKIFEIIYQDNKNITENQNGLFMFFHKLNDSTYHKIDLFLRSTTKKKTSDENNTTSDCKSESAKGYTSYVKNDFPDQESLNPKLKYSNREKNLIKRQRYDDHLNSEHNSENGVVYKRFDINVASDSEQNSQKTSSPITPTTSVQSPVSVVESQSLEEDKLKSDASSDVGINKKPIKKAVSKKVAIKKPMAGRKKKEIEVVV